MVDLTPSLRVPSFSRPASVLRDYAGARKFSRQIVLTYCGIFYLIPFVIFMVIGNPLEIFMVPTPSYWAGISFVAMAVLLFYWASALPVLRLDLPRIGISAFLFGANSSLVLSIFFAGFAYWSRSFLGLSFRQSGVSLADVGAIGFLLEVLKMTLGVMIIVHYRMISEKCEARRRTAALLFTALGFFFSIQGAFDIFFVFCALVATGLKWRRFFGLHLKIVRRLTIVAFPILGFLALFVGTANKVGVEQALIALSNIEQISNLVIGRIGYHFYSTSIHATDNFTNFNMAAQAFSELASVTHYRMSAFFGFGGVEKPDVGTISRMNFLYMSPEYHPRIGASPSMLGSVFFWPGAGFAIIYYVFIMRFVLFTMWDIIGSLGKNWAFTIFCMILLGSILDASVDTLNPFSHGAVRLVFLILGARFVTQRLKQKHMRSHAISSSTG